MLRMQTNMYVPIHFVASLNIKLMRILCNMYDSAEEKQYKWMKKRKIKSKAYIALIIFNVQHFQRNVSQAL